MPESGENPVPKPGDLFLGVVDFFSTLLPGVLLALLVLKAVEQSCSSSHSGSILCQVFHEVPHESAQGWVAFGVVSYILGRFVFLVGAFFLDDFYDHTYRRWYRKKADPLRDRVAHAYSLGESILAWATAIVRLESPSASAEIDRLEADSKFFRSLGVVLLLAMVVVAFGAPTNPESPIKTDIARAAARWIFIGGWVAWGFLIKRYAHPEYLIRKRAYQIWEDSGKPTDKALDHWLEAEKLFELRYLLIVASMPVVSFAAALFAFGGSTDLFVVGMVYLALLLASLWRFMERRLKRTELTYEFCITLARLRAHN